MSPRPADHASDPTPPSADGPSATEWATRLVDAAEVPEERRRVVGAALAQLLALAASLEELPLEGVPPAPGEPGWQ
jgi:hypothetical protein